MTMDAPSCSGSVPALAVLIALVRGLIIPVPKRQTGQQTRFSETLPAIRSRRTRFSETAALNLFH